MMPAIFLPAIANRLSFCYSEEPYMKVRLQLIGIVVAVAMLAGCGATGVPLPPSLELPRTVTDLTATRKGNKVTLVWTVPTQTTDGENIRANRLGPVQVCRAVARYPMPYCMQLVGEVPAANIPVSKPGEKASRLTFTDTLSEAVEQQNPTEFATYAVSMLNWRSRTAGLSNQVRVPLAPVIAPPSTLEATVTADGVVLQWMGTPHEHPSPDLQHIYRVYRRTEGQTAAVAIGEVQLHTDPHAVFIDHTFEWEKTYYYYVTPVTIVMQNGQKIAEVEGDNSPEVKVFTRDIFPPAVPSGLQAVNSGVGQKPFIDLTWAPDTSPDLAGYNVYRHEAERQWVKINTELVKTPSFRDTNVEPGKTYYYAVTAVDVRGNESAKSEETSERVP
jgi:fibronectin type 3 domain-containing protein